MAASSRPFAVDRDGVVGGEGAAAVILESREHAKKRGAKIIADVAGYSCNYGTPPSGQHGSAQGLRQAIGRAMEAADASAADIGVAVCHAMGDRMDQIDAEVHADLVPNAIVTAPKERPVIQARHVASGELAVASLALQHGLVPPTVNADAKDPGFEIDLACKARKTDSRFAIQSNHSGSGNAIAVVLKKD
ncbi:MAG: hypothetical protein R3C05_24455 [Pirellulaceae bacterium]